MKKLALLVTAVLLLFLASGCQEAAPKRVEQTAEGMILVNGPVEGEPDVKIYGEPDPETMVSFPLDAAMVYYGSDPNGFGGAGQQAKLLAAEGIEVTGGVVDLSRYQWKNEV